MFGDNNWKLPLHGKEIVNASPESTESPRKDEPKEEHTSLIMVIKLTKIKDKDKILKATREK